MLELKKGKEIDKFDKGDKSNFVKSPSDTTLYAPALNKVSGNVANNVVQWGVLILWYLNL